MSTLGPPVTVEGGPRSARDSRVPTWPGWPLLVLCAAPLVVMAVVARRVLVGDTMLFGPPPDVPFPFRDRVLLYLQVSGSDAHWAGPLLGLAALAWWALHTRALPAALLRCGAALAAVLALAAGAWCALVGYVALTERPEAGSEGGFFGSDEALLELLGQRTASTALLSALAAALAVVLLAAARPGAPGEPESAPPEDETDLAPEPEGEPGATPVQVEDDPHARYRRQV